MPRADTETPSIDKYHLPVFPVSSRRDTGEFQCSDILNVYETRAKLFEEIL